MGNMLRNTFTFSSLMACGERCGGCLHGDEAEDLEQVRDHHVAVRAGLFIKCGAFAEAQRLGHVDLDVIDEVAIPDGLEQAVGEAERQDVLRRLLAEEMIDAKDLALVEHFVELGVQLLRTRQIGAEWLLHDDARILDQPRFAQHAHCREGSTRRHGEIVQAPAFRTDGLFRARHGIRERRGTGLQWHVIEAACECLPLGIAELAHGLIAGVARQLAEAIRVERIERHADDAQ
jgi:hypothetical protein